MANRTQKKQKKRAAKLAVGASVATIIAALLAGIVFLHTLYREYHPANAYETTFDWYSMSLADAILTDDSDVKFYTAPYENTFYQGATLIMLYNNLSDHDRIITSFTVHAEDIVVDESPVLSCDFSPSSDAHIIGNFYNSGWSASGPLEIHVTGFTPLQDTQDVSLSVSEDVCTSWTCSSIPPGEYGTVELLDLGSIDIHWPQSGPDAPVSYLLHFTLHAPETGYSTQADCQLQVWPDRIQVLSSGIGGPDNTYYAVLADTSEPSWEHTYRTSQILPAGQAIRIPIAIIPTKSCSMTVRLSFKTLDGETFDAYPIEDAHFIVSYYEEHPAGYMDGLVKDYNQLYDKPIAYYWPFAPVTSHIPPS